MNRWKKLVNSPDMEFCNLEEDGCTERMKVFDKFIGKHMLRWT